MAHNENFVLFSISNHDNTLLAQVQLRFSAGDYQVLAGAIDDGWGWSWTPWVTVTDGPHALELNWQAASAAGANNGGLTFWVDGVQQGSFTNIDNDTRRIDYAQLGAVGGVDNGTRGTIYFDAFESRRQSYIGLAPGAPAPPPFPDKPDALFADGFEAGDLSAWSSSATDGGDLSVSSQAAITGSYGLQAVLDDNNSIYVTDWSPFEEAHYRARFYFDPNSIPMTNGNAHYIFYALNHDDNLLMQEWSSVITRPTTRCERIRSTIIGTGAQTAWVTVSDGPHAIEFELAGGDSAPEPTMAY